MSFELAEQILMFMNSEMNVSSKDIEKNKIRGPTIEQLTGYFVKVYYEEILIDSLIPPKLVQ